jgi:ABC-type nitrate/sulfonate/bicarbonate transport system substrate-binding protein
VCAHTLIYAKHISLCFKNHALIGGSDMKRVLASLVAFIAISTIFPFTIMAAKLAPLKVGIMPSAVGAPVQYALEKGYFKDEDLDIEIVIFPSGAPINEAMASKRIDVACSGAATIFSLASGYTKLLADVESSGGMGIWVRPNSPIMSVKGKVPGKPEIYGSAETIKGKTFLASLGTASQFNVLRYIERFGLKDTDIHIVNMDWGAAAQAFISGEADAIATFAPYSFQVIDKGAVLATTFEDATGTALYDMVFAHKDVIANRRADLVKFMRAFERAVEELGNNDNLRSEFSMRWFAQNGRNYSKETMNQELKDRRYVTKAVMSSPGYVFGEAIPDYASFQASVGQIDKNDLKNVYKSFDPTILEEAIGIKLKVPNIK